MVKFKRKYHWSVRGRKVKKIKIFLCRYTWVRSVVTKHLKNICESVDDNGKTYQYEFYSLSVIIAVGGSDELCQIADSTVYFSTHLWYTLT